MSGVILLIIIIILIIIGAIYLHSDNDSSSVTNILSQRRYDRTPNIKKQDQQDQQNQQDKKHIHLMVHKKNPESKLSVICPSCRYKVSVNKTGKSKCPVCSQSLEFL